MNLNDLAREVTLKEGGKVNLSIAQVKEVTSILLRILASKPQKEVDRTLVRYRKAGRGMETIRDEDIIERF